MGKSILTMMSAAAMVLFCSGCDNGEEFQTPPSVEGIVLSRDEIVLEKGQKAVLEYVIQPDGAVPEGEVVTTRPAARSLMVRSWLSRREQPA